ncbi:hypothetical protein niasHT_015524 [Heterodera trifolii]|uniref:Uncharacterized protein n=1 Tax=Heterodera trifolii TaxID=157864 RepID=A0ABD2L057_9BILA
MDSLPTSPSYFVSDNVQSPADSSPELSMAQIDGLFSRLPRSDQDRYITELSRCRSADFTSASPLIIFAIGSSYFLDSKMKFGPFRVPFYILIGVGTAAISTILYKNSCGQRVRQALAEELRKEQQNANINLTSSDSYRQKQQTNQSEFFRSEGPAPGWGGTSLSDNGRPSMDGPTFSGTPTNIGFGGGRRDQ